MSTRLADVALFALSKQVTLPLLAYVLYRTLSEAPKAAGEVEEAKEPEEELVLPALQPEDPAFNWEEAKPFPYRPFKKGPYQLVMGIHNTPPEEWFFIEDTYKEYTDLKWKYVQDPTIRDHTIFMTEDNIPATIEFYERATQFMLQRYPMCFEIRGDQIYNKIRDDYIPLDPYSVADKKMLHVYLSRTLEEDYILLTQDPANYETDEYIFKGGVFAFAAGFDPLDRFQTPLTVIHGPVPEYKTKLRPQMNRFFDKLKPGSFVRRNNWSIQTHNKVLVMTHNKGKEEEEMRQLDPETLDFEREVFFRSERQILTKLPKSGAIVFSIRTYLTSMKQLRDEGHAEELIGGIGGMTDGIGQYKRQPEWGEAVCAFLRGETDGAHKPEIKGLA